MASVDECYDYYDEDEGEEGLLVDEDDVGLLEDEEALPEFRADHWAITRKSLSAAQQQELSMVMNLVNLEPHNARALLMHHRWKMDRITDFLERRGREGLFREAGIVVPPEENSTALPFGTAADKGAHKRPIIATCNVCFDDVSQLSDVSTMDCGHCFCNDCEYLHAPQLPLPRKCLLSLDMHAISIV
ncbi:hypothetical protein ACQ4PT_014775 [Festuca glaucescens]